jgi:alkylhydroperoxidase family enzyme
MTTPRLQPTTPDDWDDETRALMDAVGPLNIFATLAHHPKLLKRWMVFGSHVLAKSTLPPRDRELLILRTGWRCGCDYEFGQHTVIAATVGVSSDEVARITRPSTDGWSGTDRDLLVAADELIADHRLGNGTWERLAARWSDQQVLDLIFTVGQYSLVCMALNSLGVQREPGVPGFPGDEVRA